MAQPNFRIKPEESKIIERVRDLDLSPEEIALISDRQVASALVRHLRAYLKTICIKGRRNSKPNVVEILKDLDRSSESLEAGAVHSQNQDNESITWDDVTIDGDWEDLYPGVKLLTQEEVAELMGKSLSSIQKLIKERKLLPLGLGGRRGIRFPAEQFQRGQPIEGLADVLAIIVSPTLAWQYLTNPLWIETSSKRPIDILKSSDPKNKSRIISAAQGFGSDFS